MWTSGCITLKERVIFNGVEHTSIIKEGWAVIQIRNVAVHMMCRYNVFFIISLWRKEEWSREDVEQQEHGYLFYPGQ
jgi:hypothetical protein